MRFQQLFNQNWLFLPAQVDHSTPDAEFESITLPHTNKLLPRHYFDSSEYAFISTYRKHFTLPQPADGRRVYLDFEGAMIASTVTINGHTFPEYRGGYTPFSFDITDYLATDGQNTVTVHLDSSERADIPPFGYVVDYLTFGGIYREVSLRMVNPCHVKHVFIRPEDVLTAPRIVADVHILNQNNSSVTGRIVAIATDAEGTTLTTLEHPFTADANGEMVITLSSDVLENIALWSIDNPYQYHMRFEIFVDGQSVDIYEERFGFRHARFDQDGNFYLNGEPLYLFGLNRHQTFPFIGAAAPARLQKRDADIVKYELGCNLVRTSHYPQSRHFLDRCDEIGLLVFEEIPGWQHIGDEAWQSISLRDVQTMIERDRNRPSIILWGVRINESLDNDDFYTKTNALAHQLDPTRQTGGVRYFQDSNFLEDVFTFNDFSNDIQEPHQTPHMVTEFNGHMFPTKVWDQEERLVEHALRHAKIHDRGMSMGGVSGTIAWCAFDYNTHQQFGSGDRICYHGVMDIFRINKWAGEFYASQTSPESRIVLHPATIWAMGERNASVIDPLVVFSNCEEIEVFVGDNLIGRYSPSRDQFPSLPYPPFMVTMGTSNLSWGSQFPNLKVIGYINNQPVAQREIDATGLPKALSLELDDSEIVADGADITRAVLKLTDQFGNRIPYANIIASFEVEGPVELIGENPIGLFGGQVAVYLKAKHESGTATLTVKANGFDAVSRSLTLIASDLGE
jgi:beta-galactosidase